MSKAMSEMNKKTVPELEKAIADIKIEIARLVVEASVSAQKNSNTIPDKRKELAVLLTALRQKKS